MLGIKGIDIGVLGGQLLIDGGGDRLTRGNLTNQGM